MLLFQQHRKNNQQPVLFMVPAYPLSWLAFYKQHFLSLASVNGVPLRGSEEEKLHFLSLTVAAATRGSLAYLPPRSPSGSSIHKQMPPRDPDIPSTTLSCSAILKPSSPQPGRRMRASIGRRKETLCQLQLGETIKEAFSCFGADDSLLSKAQQYSPLTVYTTLVHLGQ